MKSEFMRMFEVQEVPHPEKIESCELPGTALAHGTYSGFGKQLCYGVDEFSEKFEESEEDVE